MKDIQQCFIEYCEFEQKCTPQLRKVFFSNGSEHLRYQCMTCGKVHGNTVSKRDKDLSKIPYFDNEKLENYHSKNKEKFDLRAKRWDLFMKAECEAKNNRIQYFEHLFKVKYENFEQAYDLYMNSPYWQVKRKKIIERDGNKCRLCYQTGTVDVHHMNYKNLCNESEHELLCLCKDCHRMIHGHIVNE